MNSEIIDTYEIINTLLNTAELKGLGYNLVKTFLDTIPKIKTKVESLIPRKVETVVYSKIDMFKKNVRTKIIDLFVNTIEEENKKLDFHSKIYDLIPKYFISTFKATLANIFNEKIESTIDLIKESYKSKVSSDLSLLVQNFERYGGEISRILSLEGILVQDREW